MLPSVIFEDAGAISSEARTKAARSMAARSFLYERSGTPDLFERVQTETAKFNISLGTDNFLVDNMYFRTFICLVVLLNTVQMGVEADRPDLQSYWDICENCFTALFLFEMIVKIAATRWVYFQDYANWLDASLVMLSVVDTWVISRFIEGTAMELQMLSVLRIVRLFRLVRVMRLIKHFKHLALVFSGVIEALRTTVYVAAVLLMFLYVFALFCTVYLGRPTTLYPGYAPLESEIDEQEVMLNYNPYLCFGSMSKSMLTLFNMAIMAEWTEIVRPVSQKQPHYVLVFLVFAMIVSFGVMNVIIGMIVENVMGNAKAMEAEDVARELKRKGDVVEQIRLLIIDLDTDGDNEITLEELKSSMREVEGGDSKMTELLKTADLPVGCNAEELFYMLDQKSDGMLHQKEFMGSLYRLIEGGSFQLMCLLMAGLNETKLLIKTSHTFTQQSHADMQYKLERLGQDLSELKQDYAASSLTVEHAFSGGGKQKAMGISSGDCESQNRFAKQTQAVLECGPRSPVLLEPVTPALKTAIDLSPVENKIEPVTSLLSDNRTGALSPGSGTLALNSSCRLDSILSESGTFKCLGRSATQDGSDSGLPSYLRLRGAPPKDEAVGKPGSEPSPEPSPFDVKTDSPDSFLNGSHSLLPEDSRGTLPKRFPIGERRDVDAGPYASEGPPCTATQNYSDGVRSVPIPLHPSIARECAETWPGSEIWPPGEKALETPADREEDDACPTSHNGDQTSSMAGTVAWRSGVCEDDRSHGLLLAPDFGQSPSALKDPDASQSHTANSADILLRSARVPECNVDRAQPVVLIPDLFETSHVLLEAPQFSFHAVPSSGMSTQEVGSPQSHCITFRDSGSLGFEVRWRHGLHPIVGIVKPNSEAARAGVAEGNFLVSCNDISTKGKRRLDGLELLRMRPLKLELKRSISKDAV